MKAWIALAATILLLASPALGADITGRWTAKVVLGNGRSGAPAFVFKQDGAALTGTYSGVLGDSALTGTVKGSDVDFHFEVFGRAIRYMGKVNAPGNAIEGTVDYAGESKGTFSATRK
ncbi:MAG: hypothetical protein WDN01_14540 [Rhizomicrobium sp.]